MATTNTPAGDPASSNPSESSRREFLTGVCALSVAAAAVPAQQPKLPQMMLGKYSVSRLICGGNPFNAGSHLSVFVNQEMRRYFTPEQVLKTLRRCQEVGINCWQSSGKNFELYQRLRDEGGEMHYLSLSHAEEKAGTIPELARAGCIGIAHHGEVTDNLFKQGKIDQVHDYLKKVHDGGMLAGVSTHMPAVVDTIESKGWEVDFYMSCVYERHRSEADLEKLLGQVPLWPGEVYLKSDPARMYKAMRASKHPCLAFKILAAGRLSERKDWIEQAFQQAYTSMKPNDGVIIGIYDKFSDQPAEDAELVRRYALPTGTAART